MSGLRATTIALALAALVVGGGVLRAQSAGEVELPNITIPTEQEIENLPSAEIRERASEFIGAMQAIHEHTVKLQGVAREARDVIKLNCVNDKLLQVKQLLNIGETSRNDLVEAIARADDAGRTHHFTQVAVTYEGVSALRDEARACVGEQAVFLGPTQVDVEGPDLVDDPTAEAPFADFEIEDPGYASPFF